MKFFRRKKKQVALAKMRKLRGIVIHDGDGNVVARIGADGVFSRLQHSDTKKATGSQPKRYANWVDELITGHDAPVIPAYRSGDTKVGDLEPGPGGHLIVIDNKPFVVHIDRLTHSDRPQKCLKFDVGSLRDTMIYEQRL